MKRERFARPLPSEPTNKAKQLTQGRMSQMVGQWKNPIIGNTIFAAIATVITLSLSLLTSALDANFRCCV
jgi:hypothetical protein